jgi:hypothetical protein
MPPPGGAGGPSVTRLSQLAAIMRPELPDLAREIIAEIRERIPEYARPMESPYGHALRAAVQQALTSFFDAIAEPGAPQEQRDYICRRLGQSEAAEGRSLDSLQAAYRIGAHVGWRRVMDVGLGCGAPSAVMSQIADAVLAYMDELATLSRQGYLEEKARSERSREEWRKRLLHLILERPQAPRRAIEELAELTGWVVPEEVTLVALDHTPAAASASHVTASHASASHVTASQAAARGGAIAGPAAADPACAAWFGDLGALVEPGGARPCALLTGAVDAARRQVLAGALAGRRAAVGLTVPLPEAIHSLRWARRALSLSRAGVIGGGGVIYCEDHIVALWLLSDEPLVDQLARRKLSPLAGLTPLQRQRLTQTLGIWLETRGTAPEMAERLNVHPQTFRYRMRKLEAALGGVLDDPAERFALELVLRATRLRRRAADGHGQPTAATEQGATEQAATEQWAGEQAATEHEQAATEQWAGEQAATEPGVGEPPTAGTGHLTAGRAAPRST